jgi:hypothetical protein
MQSFLLPHWRASGIMILTGGTEAEAEAILKLLI